MYSDALRARIYQICRAVERDQARINRGEPLRGRGESIKWRTV